MRIFRKFLVFFSIGGRERVLFLEALALLIGWRLRILLLPLRSYVHRFGTRGSEHHTEGAESTMQIREIQQAVRRAESVLPWKSKCLTEAVTTKLLLQRKSIKSTLFLGVAREGESSLIAHAWLKSGSRIVAGEKGYEKFTVVEKFS